MFRLVKFGTLSLEHYNQVDNIGGGAAPAGYQALPEGGALDMYGSRQTRPGTVERVKSLRLRGEDAQDLEDLYLQLLALGGTRAKLYRRDAAGNLEWQYARLAEVAAQYNYEMAQYRLIHDVDLRFITQDATWRAETQTLEQATSAWYLNDGYDLNDGLYFNGALSDGAPGSKTIQVGLTTDPGRAPVKAITITVTAGDAELTALTIARTSGETLEWAGSLAIGKSLVIDTGTMRVTNDGADAYDELTFTATADMAAWFTLQLGSNILTITPTGGGVGLLINFQFYEARY